MVTATVYIVQRHCVVLEFIVVTASVDIVQLYCVVCGVYCGYINRRYSAMLLCCVWRSLWLQQHYLYCNVTELCVEFIVVTATVNIVQSYYVVLEFIVVTATVDIVQWYCVVCGVYCVDSNCRYSAMVLCCV